MILGSIIGFLIGTGFGLAASSPWPAALWHSCAAALIAAVLARWWGRVWIKGLQDSLHHRRNQRPAPADSKAAVKI